MSTLTSDQFAAITTKLASMPVIPSGLGSTESACSIAAINLALSGRLTDDIPDCMSEVVGRWIITIQDAMPAEMRNSACWRGLLPLAAGTGRTMERERAKVALDWMWGAVLPQHQPIADVGGYGKKWKAMTTKRTAAAAEAAAAAAAAAEVAATDARWSDARWSVAATDAAEVAATDARWSVAAATAARWSADAAVAAVARWSAEAARKRFWLAVDPCACLERMIAAKANP